MKTFRIMLVVTLLVFGAFLGYSLTQQGAGTQSGTQRQGDLGSSGSQMQTSPGSQSGMNQESQGTWSPRNQGSMNQGTQSQNQGMKLTMGRGPSNKDMDRGTQQNRQQNAPSGTNQFDQGTSQGQSSQGLGNQGQSSQGQSNMGSNSMNRSYLLA